jgi:hypothetical protein
MRPNQGLLTERIGPADLDHGHHVQGVVELAVPGPRQPVADDLAAGGLQGGGAGVSDEMMRAHGWGAWSTSPATQYGMPQAELGAVGPALEGGHLELVAP